MKIFGFNITRDTDNKLSSTERVKAMNYYGSWFSNNTPQINKSQMYQFYKNNKVVRACVHKISKAIGMAGYDLVNSMGEKVSIEDIPEEYTYIDNVLNNPTFLQNKVEIVKHLTVSGELYILPTTSPLDSRVNGFQILHSKTMTPVIKGGQIIGFLQKSGAKYKKYYADIAQGGKPTETVTYFQYEKDVNNEYMGLGILNGLVYDLLSDEEASKRNYKFFQNYATPPVMIMLDDNMTEEQVDLLEEQISDRVSGSDNAHKPFIGVGVRDIKPISLSPKDMEHINMKKMTKEDICIAYEVPKAMLGVTENVNYNNAVEMKKEFVEGTVNPHQDLFEHVVNTFLETYVPEFEYRVEFEKINVFNDKEYDELVMKKIRHGVLTVNEARELQGREKFENEQADSPLITKDMVMLEDIILDPIIDTGNT